MMTYLEQRGKYVKLMTEAHYLYERLQAATVAAHKAGDSVREDRLYSVRLKTVKRMARRRFAAVQIAKAMKEAEE